MTGSAKVGDSLLAAVVASGQTWDLDKLILKDTGRVAIATNGGLRLPNAQAIESNGHVNNLIRFDGGTLVFDDPEEALTAALFDVAVNGDSAFVGDMKISNGRKLVLKAGDLCVRYLYVDGKSLPRGTHTAAELNALAGVSVASGAGSVTIQKSIVGTVLNLL